jgi:Tol biopolymer transport system component
MKKSAFILFSVLLSACAATTPTPLVMPKATSTVTPKASSTPTVAMKVTVQPSTDIPKPTKTVAINPILAAYNAHATKVAEFSITCELIQGDDYFISPNGNWLAAQCAPSERSNPKQNIDLLEIVNKEGKHWMIHAKDYDSDGVKSTYWSSDEKYLYFETRFNVDAFGGFACFFGSPGATSLYRLALDNGIVSNVLPADKTLYNFSFSPTGRKLAYRGSGLTILDLQTGEETNINVDAIVGTLTWSPDGLELAYVTCQESPDGYGINNDYAPKESAIKIYSLKQNVSRTILEVKKRLLLIESWNSNNILRINNQDEHYNSEYLFFNLNTNQWVTPIPTPQQP